MKVISIILIIAVSIFSLLGCSANTMPQIGYSVYDMKFDFFKEMEKGTRSHLKELGYSLVVDDQKSSTEKQISGCRELLEKGVKVLIVSPIDVTAMEEIVEEAHLYHVPVIINDIGSGGSNYDAFVVSDSIEGGRMAGEYLHSVLLEQNRNDNAGVVVFRNNPQVAVAHSRGDGFLEIANEYGWQTIKDVVAEGEMDTAYNMMKELLKQTTDIDAVFCTNDPMALGVVKACEEEKITNVNIIGFNGDADALKAIRDGRMLATVQQYPYAMGEIAADLADMLYKDIEIDFDIPENKTILVPVMLIDADNVQDAFKALH